jgi:hypothetical protein
MEILFLGHAGIIIKKDSILFAVDPFISGEFYWAGKKETYRGNSKWIGNINSFLNTFGDSINGIGITHAHGDHCDLPLLLKLLQINYRIKLLFPLPIIDWLKYSSIFNPLITHSLEPVRSNGDYILKHKNGTMHIHTLPLPGVEKKEYPERVGYYISDDDIGLFIPGDVHDVGEWDSIKNSVSDLILWGIDKCEEIINYFNSSHYLKRIWWIHWESFIPGNILCNVNPRKLISDIGNSNNFKQFIPNFTDWYSL